MKETFRNTDVMLAGLALLLAMCSGCQFQGGDEPGPQPEPFPTPDPINTNGPDPVDPDPIDTNGEAPADPDPINDEDPAVPQNSELLVGAWLYVDGYALSSYDDTFELQFVEFDSNGTSTMYLLDDVTETKECRTAVYAHSGTDDLIIDQEIGSPKAYKFEFDEQDTLYITNGDLETSVLTRVSDVPFDSRCFAMREEQRFELDLKIDASSELGYDGQNLWVTEYENEFLQYPVNISTGELGASVDFGGARRLKFMQEGDLWSTCGCGGESKLDRHRLIPPAKIDSFDVNTLGFTLNINAATVNDGGDEILLHGYHGLQKSHRFLAVDVATKEVAEAGDLDLNLKSITYYLGEYVLAIHGNHMIFIDLDELKTIATFRLPDSRVKWYGVEMVGTEIWIVGRMRYRDTSVLMQVSTPQAIALPGQAGGILDPILNP